MLPLWKIWEIDFIIMCEYAYKVKPRPWKKYDRLRQKAARIGIVENKHYKHSRQPKYQRTVFYELARFRVRLLNQVIMMKEWLIKENHDLVEYVDYFNE